MIHQIVIDTNVFISALRSRKGASYKLLSMFGAKAFEINISVPLIIEYEDVAKRKDQNILLNWSDIDDILDHICHVANQHEIFFLWRPFLKDPKDDLVLELAVKSESKYIITYNQKDFGGSKKFGITILTPKDFLMKIGEL